MADSHQKKAIFFPDTNIALHYLRFDQIKWNELTKHKNVEIVICPVFLKELDAAKTFHDSKKIRHRAGDYLTWIVSKLEEPTIAAGVSVIFDPNEPQIDFDKNRLDPKVPDDRLIASVLSYCENYPGHDVCVLSGDAGVTVKSKLRKIPVTGLPAEYKLTELDSEEKELKQLRDRLAKLENRLPKPKVFFKEGKDYLPIKRPEAANVVGFIRSQMVKVKEKVPLLIVSVAESPAPPVIFPANVISKTKKGFDIKDFAMDPAEIVEYENKKNIEMNRGISVYYDQYESYLNELVAYHLRGSAIFDISLILSNEAGSAPANSVEVYLSCDEDLIFTNSKIHGDAPKPPPVPIKNRTLFRDEFSQTLFRNIPDLWRNTDPDRDRLNIDENRADFWIFQVKHRQSKNLMPIYLDFGAPERIRNAKISYEIHASEIVDPIKGILNITFI